MWARGLAFPWLSFEAALIALSRRAPVAAVQAQAERRIAPIQHKAEPALLSYKLIL